MDFRDRHPDESEPSRLRALQRVRLWLLPLMLLPLVPLIGGQLATLRMLHEFGGGRQIAWLGILFVATILSTVVIVGGGMLAVTGGRSRGRRGESADAAPDTASPPPSMRVATWIRSGRFVPYWLGSTAIAMLAAVVITMNATARTRAAAAAVGFPVSAPPPGEVALLLIPALLVPLALYFAYRGQRGAASQVGTERSAASTASVAAVSALENACISAGLPMPRLKVLDQPGINAFIVDPPVGKPSLTVSTGMLRVLDPHELEPVFAALLARLKSGAAQEGTMTGRDVAGPLNLEDTYRTADAQALLWVRDPARVLSAMHKVAVSGNRMSVENPPSPICFYTWPYAPPPHDMPERVRRMVDLAGHEGRTWWDALQRQRMADAGRDVNAS